MSRATLGPGLSPTRAVLGNGVVILAHESPATPTVAINATFRSGSIDDPPDLPGVADLTRRIIDRGTPVRSAEAIAEMLDDRGVSLRITVSRHSFSLSCVCLTEHLDDLLTLVGDIVRNPVFPVAELERRRSEAITSVHEDQDDPSKVASDLLMEMLYGAGHPYGRLITGTVASLEAIGQPDLLAYHADRLVPAAFRLAVAGDVAPGVVLERAARLFDGWRGPAPADEPVPPPPVRRSRIVHHRRMPGKSQSDICYGFTTIRRVDPRYYAFWILNNVLGQFGLGGRLADNIRERQGMAYYAYSNLEATVGEGALVIRAGVDPGHVDRTLEAVDAEVRALGQAGPTIEELEDTRASLIGAVPRMLETNESTAAFLQHAEHFGLGLDYDQRLPSLLQAVTLDEVREAGAELLDPARAAVAVAGPE